MSKISQTENQITIKQNGFFLMLGIGALLMAIEGIRMIFGLLPFEEGYTFADILGLSFICVWVIVVLSMVVFAFNTNSKKMILNVEGILCKSLLNKKFIEWTDVKDWGLSYCGQTRGEGNTYYLYFAKNECRTKNDCKKKLKGKMIKIIVMGDEYLQMVNEVISFCEDKTNVSPFIAKDKYHFI